MNRTEWQVCQYLEEIQEGIILFLRELVAEESVNPPGDTRGPAQVIAQKLGEYGIPCQEISVHQLHKSLLASIGNGSKSLLFNAHLDTVPIGSPEEWTVDPFHEPPHAGVLYGRGCADDKGGAAAMVMAVCALQHCGIRLQGRLTVNPVADEENGGENGVKYLLEQGILRPEPDMVVVGEITSNDVAIVHKGLIWFEITSRGKTAHASTPWDGINAIGKMIGFLHKLERYYQEELPRHTSTLTPPASYNIGTITGGPRVNVVPDICTVMLDRRILPEESLEMAESELRLLLEEYAATGRTFLISTHIIEEAADVLEDVIILHEGKILVTGNTQAFVDSACHVSGKAEEVDAAVAGLEVHHTETVGRSKGVTVFLKPGQKVDESRDVSVQPVSLQRAFVALCGEEEGK